MDESKYLRLNLPMHIKRAGNRAFKRALQAWVDNGCPLPDKDPPERLEAVIWSIPWDIWVELTKALGKCHSNHTHKTLIRDILDEYWTRGL